VAITDLEHYPKVVVGGQALTLHTFHLVLSHSRKGSAGVGT